MAGKRDRPAVKRAKRKTWYAEHHRGLRVVFKEMHIVSKHDPAGLPHKDVVRLIKHALPGLPKKTTGVTTTIAGVAISERRNRWSGGSSIVHTRNMAPYTHAEIAEFDRIRDLFVQAAIDFDIDIPWRDNVEEVIEQVADSDDEGNDEGGECDGDARADENMYAHT